MTTSISGTPVYTLHFDYPDLNDCAGVFTSARKAIDALMFHYNRMKKGLDWRWTEPVLDDEADWIDEATGEKGWLVYRFDLIHWESGRCIPVGASIERIFIDAV